MLYQIGRKAHPSVYDYGTVYSCLKACTQCNGIYDISTLGLFLPSWKKPFGLVKAIGGIVGSAKAIDYLLGLGLTEFQTRPINISWGNRPSVDENYYEIVPSNVIELDTSVGPGPITVCGECGRKEWQERDLELPRLKDVVESHIFKIKDTFMFIGDDYFAEMAAKIPDGCYLSFEKWYCQ
jgi:hypothetical protein